MPENGFGWYGPKKAASRARQRGTSNPYPEPLPVVTTGGVFTRNFWIFYRMKPFLNEDFLLQTETARQLYHEFARPMPIIDYHCHLPPDQIAQDRQFDNLTQIWLYGDHYKWRAMRTNGVHESYCTGDQPDEAKFQKWAETVPYTVRNPLFHWTHLELQRYFGVTELLNGQSARRIFDQCS